MAFQTISLGLTIKIPTPGTKNWATTLVTELWNKLSAHDHTGSGKGVQIGENALATNSISSAKIKDDAITTAKLDDGAVTEDKIGTGAVTEDKIGANAVTYAKLSTQLQDLFIPSGAVSAYVGTVAPNNWVLAQGGTIGSASSGATARANADTETLFTILYNSMANSEAPVSGGRGANAAADFAANKTITLPDMRQRFPIGKAASGTGNVLGGTGGSIDHTHSVPAHYHGMGTGADLNITSSGTHTTAIDHDHGSVNSGSAGSHKHKTDGAGSFVGNAGSGGSANITVVGGSYQLSDFTDTSLDHTHTVDLPNFTGNSSSTGSHTHPSGNIAGRVGLVTGGVDGNSAMTSGSNNPPFLALNYIIKL